MTIGLAALALVLAPSLPMAAAAAHDPSALPVSPAPHTVRLDGGSWTPPPGPLRVLLARGTPPDQRAVLLAAGARFRLVSRGPSVTVQPAAPPLSAEAYRLQVGTDGVHIQVSAAAGLRHALDTLAQLHASGPLPTGHIEDTPALRDRWVHVQLPGRTTGGVPEFPRQKARVGQLARYTGTADYLPLLHALADDAAAARLNGVVLELNGMWQFPSHPELALPEAVPLTVLRDWVASLRSRGLEVIPLLPLFSHQEQLLGPVYPELLLTPMGKLPKKRGSPPDTTFWWNPLYDPREPRTRTIVTELIDDLFDVFDPHTVHIGHDEAGAMRFVQSIDPVALFAESVAHAHRELTRRGATTAIWADMLLDGQRLAGTAHGNEMGVKTWKAIRHLPEDVMLVDWQYHGAPAPWPDTGELPDVPTLRYLAETGHPVMGASLGRPATHPRDRKRFGRHVEQSARIARTLATLAQDGNRTVRGQITTQYGWTPGRLSPWEGTDVAGAVWLAGWHGWTGGAVVWPPAPGTPNP